MALDAATAAFVERMAVDDVRPTHLMTIDEARELMVGLAEMIGPGPQMAEVNDGTVPGTTITFRMLKPVDRPRGLVVYLHGGGWVMGSAAEWETLGRLLARDSGCAVMLVDYRRAPEDPFPAAVDDCFAAVRWAADHIADIAGADVPLVVAGDSAGGNLAAAVALRARDEGGVPIDLQLLVYPVCDADFSRESYNDPANQLILNRKAMEWFWGHYVPATADREHPYASPLRAGDLARLPPAVMVLAEHDPLLDEGLAYARRLRDAGVAVETRTFPGQMHGFFSLVGLLPGGEDARRFVVAALDHHLRVTASRPDGGS